MSPILRPATLTDLPYVYEICHRTAYNGQDASPVVTDPYIFGHYYAAPYIVQCPDWCWIAEDQLGVVGYLVTTPDTREYTAWFNREWLPRVRAYYSGSTPEPGWTELEKWMRSYLRDDATLPDFVDAYPAHLHIDFLPRGQGKGLGTAAIRQFEEKLENHGRPGYYLAMAEGNHRARPFYDKLGLELIRHDPGVIYLGRSLVRGGR